MCRVLTSVCKLLVMPLQIALRGNCCIEGSPKGEFQSEGKTIVQAKTSNIPFFLFFFHLLSSFPVSPFCALSVVLNINLPTLDANPFLRRTEYSVNTIEFRSKFQLDCSQPTHVYFPGINLAPKALPAHILTASSFLPWLLEYLLKVNFQLCSGLSSSKYVLCWLQT